MSTADYKVFPKHVGKWEGLVRVLDADLQETKCYKINQGFEAVDNKWVITNTYTYADGSSLTHSFDVIPLGNGEVKVETEESPLKEATMSALEHGDNIVDFKIMNATTGKLQELETINLLSERDRVRTAQLFNQEGEFKGLLVIVEHRVE